MGLRRSGLHDKRFSRGNGLALRCTAAAVALLGTVGVTIAVATNPAAASATSRYVAQGGSDTSNDCTSPATPCATISHAVSVAGFADTIYVAGRIADHVTIGTSLTITQWFNQPQAVVDGTTSGTPFIINAGTVALDQLIIENGLRTNNTGGGIENSGRLTVTNTTVHNNTITSSGSGGGISNTSNGVLTLVNSTVQNNTAPGGGGISNGGSLTLTDTTISDNNGNSRGGGIFGNGAVTVNSSTISGNTASQGGGIYYPGTRVTLTNSTVSGNRASSGGGIFDNGTTSSWLTVMASTISANTAATRDAGGGVFAGPGILQFGATIVAANNAGGVAENCGGPVSSLGYNLTDDADGTACGFTATGDVVNANPNLGSLANNGGPTQTMLPPNPSPEAFVIPNPTTLGTTQVCPRTDQRGVPSPSGGDCTIGAVEAIPGVAPAVTSASAATFTVDSAGSFTVTTTGVPTSSISESGTLPDGVSFTDNGDGTGTLSGTPVWATSGSASDGSGESYPLTLTASNGMSPDATQNFTLTVDPPSHTWTTGTSDSFTVHDTTDPSAVITHPYGQPGDGKVPNNLTLGLNPGQATFSGTPASNSGGTYHIKLVADSVTQYVNLVVLQPPVMSLPPDGGTVGFKAGVASSVPWSVTAPATTWPHITQPVNYTTSGFPAGLDFNDNGNGTGTISGTLAKGTYGPMSITASNVAGSSTTTFFIKAQ